MDCKLLVLFVCCLAWTGHAENENYNEEDTASVSDEDNCELCLHKCHHKMGELDDDVATCHSEESQLRFINSRARDRSCAIRQELDVAQANLTVCNAELVALIARINQTSPGTGGGGGSAIQ